MNRQLKLLSKEVSDLLLIQLGHEMENYLLYNTFANYFALQSIPALEEYYYKRAEEEKAHHDWILHYLGDADCVVKYPKLNTDITVESLIFPFVFTINKEIETTQMIYKIAELALSEKDYMTWTWLNKHLIPEQIEEENISRLARQIMELDADLLEKSEKVLDLLEK